jgi:hypothetical protein
MEFETHIGIGRVTDRGAARKSENGAALPPDGRAARPRFDDRMPTFITSVRPGLVGEATCGSLLARYTHRILLFARTMMAILEGVVFEEVLCDKSTILTIANFGLVL